MSTDHLIAYAHSLWPDCVARLGHDPTQFTAQILKLRGQAGSERVVLELLGDTVDLVFKCRGPSSRAEPFGVEISATQKAAQMLADQARFRAPRLLSHSAGSGWMVQSHEPGMSAKKILEIAQEEPEATNEVRAEVLAVAGAWLQAFHRAGPVQRRDVHVGAMHEHARTTLASVLSKEIDADHADLFRALGAAIDTRAQFANGKQTHASSIHGDFVPQNILIYKDKITGLDFSAEHSGPNAHDQAKFLARMHWETPAAQITPESVQSDIAALQDGYGASIEADPAFSYLFPIQVLTDLAHPKCAGQRRENLFALARAAIELPLP